MLRLFALLSNSRSPRTSVLRKDPVCGEIANCAAPRSPPGAPNSEIGRRHHDRSEEHTSELQSHVNLVCRLLLEKKKKKKKNKKTKKEHKMTKTIKNKK